MNSRSKNLTGSLNKYIAAGWFILAALMLFCSVPVLFTPAPFMVIALLLLAAIVFLVGCQRTDKLKMSEEKFRKMVRNIALLAVFISMFSIFIIGVKT